MKSPKNEQKSFELRSKINKSHFINKPQLHIICTTESQGERKRKENHESETVSVKKYLHYSVGNPIVGPLLLHDGVHTCTLQDS